MMELVLDGYYFRKTNWLIDWKGISSTCSFLLKSKVKGGGGLLKNAPASILLAVGYVSKHYEVGPTLDHPSLK